MSLLLEALKKAELAKQSAQPEPAAPSPEPRVELKLEEESRPSVITRESLPDITQPLEIRAEDFNSGAKRQRPPDKPETEAEAPSPDPDATVSFTRPVRMEEPAPATQREAARQMFDAKEEVDYNPRKPFYVTVGVLLAAAAGYAAYVWWQMQPRYAVNTAATQAVPRAPEPSPAAVTPPAAPVADAPSAQPAGAAVSPAKAVDARRAPIADTSLKPSETPRVAPPLFVASQNASVQRLPGASAPGPAPRAAASPSRAARAAEQTPIAIKPASAQTDPVLERGYAAYQRGDWNNAREQYQRILERDATNRDALLGLAAIDARERNFETAELRYLKLLELNPRDTHAHAGLVALQGNLDTVQSESRIKSLIAGQPDATHLYFTLGNLYAGQSRWPEAQDAFFRAYSAEPDNADYAFNLAVSLDQLRQRRLAAEHYRKALALAMSRPYAFDRGQAEARARELER